MKTAESASKDWKNFIVTHGWRAKAPDLAAVLGREVDEILAVRNACVCRPLKKRKEFSELFSLWHGRAPEEGDWPLPRKMGSHGTYEWLPPEIGFLASIVGTMGVPEIAKVLTTRLRNKTGDRKATRTRVAVQCRICLIGLQTCDVVGGITISAAGRELGSTATVRHMIRLGQISARRVGRLWVIPHDSWEKWKASRVFVPEGFVQLSTLKPLLSITSDKLSEWARAGLIPTAVRCNPYGTKVRTTRFGTWYVDQKVADKLVADRRAGLPMPWHIKADPHNLRVTFNLWQQRRHPASCPTCAEIWGKQGAPGCYEEYARRYPPLAHGAKRHLTRQWTPGLTIKEVAAATSCSISRVTSAIKAGVLAAQKEGRCTYITRTDATRWKARKCPVGKNEKSWIQIKTACEQYLFTTRELRKFIASGQMKSRVGADGSLYVLRQQCRELRDRLGFSEEEAARRVGVTEERFRHLLEGVNWRVAKGIPLATVQAVIKRLESHVGYTFEEAAAMLKVTVQWVKERVADGTIRIARASWDRRRLYITNKMMLRLEKAKTRPLVEKLGPDWLLLSDAATEAGVTATMIIRWSEKGELDRRQSKVGWRYHRQAVRARARRYWKTVRYHRAIPPKWLEGARP